MLREKKQLEQEASQMMRQLTNQPKTEQEQANEFSEAFRQATNKKKNGGMLLPEIVNPASQQAPAGVGMNARYNRNPPTGLQSEQWTMSRKQQ